MPDRRPTSPSATWDEMVARHGRLAGTHPPENAEHRPEVAILACSDARVPPSLIFGQAPGTLFVVRLAGNSATAGAIASLTYAVEHLGTPLVVVLGHTGCGAVAAAQSRGSGDTAVLSPILTPIDEMLAACDACDDPDAAVAANVRQNLTRLLRDRGPLGHAIRAGRAELRGAVHDLATGRLLDVELFETEHADLPSDSTITTLEPTRSTT